MTDVDMKLSRRDFIRGVSGAAVALAAGLPAFSKELPVTPTRSRVVLNRRQGIIGADGTVDAAGIDEMLNQAVAALLETQDSASAWKLLVRPDDVVGIKSNAWAELATPRPLEQAIRAGVERAGVASDDTAVGDRGVLRDPVFARSTALINVRPMRTHAWSGVGSLIKNYIMFTPDPPSYHDNSCADLGALWHLPAVKGKTRLNVLVMLTPLFHGKGWHHFDPRYTWPYQGLLVGTDPVAVDATGLRILEAKRTEHFGEERPITPPPHHIRFADTKYALGTCNPDRIELVRLGWQEGVLI